MFTDLVQFPDNFNLRNLELQKINNAIEKKIKLFKSDLATFQIQVAQSCYNSEPYSNALVVDSGLPDSVAKEVETELCKRFPGHVEYGFIAGNPIGELYLQYVDPATYCNSRHGQPRRFRIKF